MIGKSIKRKKGKKLGKWEWELCIQSKYGVKELCICTFLPSQNLSKMISRILVSAYQWIEAARHAVCKF